jgi:ribose-phosphate pyrophosphokinase
MRNTLIFAGSSCPELTDKICAGLGMTPAAVELGQFANVQHTIPYHIAIQAEAEAQADTAQ